MTVQRSKRLLLAVPVLILTTWISITLAQQSQVKKIDDKALKDANKGSEWLSIGMGWSEQRYSTMTQINADNVSKLSLAWSYEVGTGNGAGQKTNPLFSNGVLYGVTNWSVVYAVNARNGKEIWRYEPPIDPAMRQNPGQRLCCGVNSRGVALYDNKVFVGR